MRQTEGDSKKRIAFPIQLFAEDGSTDAQIPSEIHVVPTGKWDHPVYGEMEITSADIAEFVKNFNDKVRLDIPITEGHDNGMSGGELPAIGWFTDATDHGVNGLWCGVTWTDEGKQLLQQRAFKYFSPEFYEQYTDPETGAKYSHVLVGGALTNKPYFKELAPVASFSEPSIIHQFTEGMDLHTILAKKPEELSAEEKSFVREHKTELSTEQSTAFASVLDDAGESDEDKAAREAKEAEEKAAADEAAAATAKAEEERQAAERAAAGKKIVMSEAEVTALRAKADAGQKAFDDLQAMKLGEQVGKMVFSETNTTGKFLPKQKDTVVSFMRQLSEKQRDQFINIVNAMPKADAKLFGELGDGGGTTTGGVFAEIEAKVKETRKADEKLSYSEALRKVFTENPELQTRYNEARHEAA
jgi:phage I-like protein